MANSLRWVELDFETFSACDLKICGASRYSEDPTTEIICISYSLMGEEPKLWTPEMGNACEIACDLMNYACDESITFVAHNAAFEKAIWRNIMVPVLCWPDIPNSRWHDSMAVCAMKTIPQDLDHACIVLRLPQQKDAEGSKITKGLSKANKKGVFDRSPQTLQRVYDYNKQDIRSQVELHNRVGWLPPGERRVWLLDQRINERGVRLDLPFIAAAQQIVDRASGPLLGEFSDLTGGLKPTQAQKFVGWVRENGVDIPNMKKETLAALLGEDEDEDVETDDWITFANMTPEVERALKIRQLIGSASVKKLKRMNSVVCTDGRARGLLQYHGAGPGRWAGRLFQPQNFPRGTLKVGGDPPDPDAVVEAILTGDPDYVSLVLGPPVETVVSALRHSIIADPDRCLVAGDFAGIEARIVLALAGQHDKTALMAQGVDVYCDMAKEIYRRPIDKKKDPEERQLGKGGVLGCGFQMGWRKFQATVKRQTGVIISEEDAKRVIETYRKIWAPKVPKLWYALEEAAVSTVWGKQPHEAYGVRYEMEDLWLTARLPSGRKLWYFNPQPIRKEMPWDKTDVRQAFNYQAKKTGRWITIDAYGGLLTENVVQGLARDLMVSAMFKAENNGLPVVLTVHDEIIAEPERATADPKCLENIMTDVPDWAKEIKVPVAAATWMGDRYKKAA